MMVLIMVTMMIMVDYHCIGSDHDHHGGDHDQLVVVMMAMVFLVMMTMVKF